MNKIKATYPEDLLPPCNIIIHQDTSEADRYELKPCPICKLKLKMYQIHYDEKFLMCGNVDCPYPFGITDYHVFKIECDEEFVRPECGSSLMSVTTGSTISNSDWAELETMNSDTFNSVSLVPSVVATPEETEKLEQVKSIAQSNEELQKKLQELKKINKSLYDEDFDSINSEKYIKHVTEMQERSGVQLLKTDELNKVQKVPTLGMSELKLNIDSSGSGITVKIGVADKDKK